MARANVNTKRLQAAIDESGLKRGFIADKLGIPSPRLSEKLNGHVSTLPAELVQILRIIGYGDSDIKEQRLIDWYPINGNQ